MLTIKEPFRGTRGATCSYSAAFRAKHLPRPTTEVGWERDKFRGELGVLEGKRLSNTLPDGEYFISAEGHRKIVLRKNRWWLDGNDGPITTVQHTDDILYFAEQYEMRRIGVTKPPVSPFSPSPGAMTDEDAAILFVKVKDDIAMDKGIPIKGANPQLDSLVYKRIGELTGYTPEEIEAKIVSYRSSGKKLSSLKKTVIRDGKKYENTLAKFTATRKPDAPAPLPPQEPSVPLQKKVVREVVKDLDADDLADEDLVKAWIKAKEVLAKDPSNQFNLYSKGYEFERAVMRLVHEWGVNTDYYSIEKAVARYTASGKKVSALKKKMIKAGEFEEFASRVAIEEVVDPMFAGLTRYKAPKALTEEYWEDFNQVNPNYRRDPYGRHWQVNCSHVVTTYEFRRRGFKVQAMPRPGGIGRTDSDWLGDRWMNANGTSAVSEHVPSLDALRHVVDTEWPEGGRGVMTMVWKTGGGHVINIEKVGGRMILVDAQVGKRYLTKENQKALFDRIEYSDLREYGLGRYYKTFYVRMDDKIPRKAALELVAPQEDDLLERFDAFGVESASSRAEAYRRLTE